MFKISNSFEYTDFGYTAIVDALAELDKEVEDDMFIIMGNDLKAIVRKDKDFIASKQGEILYTGQFGAISGLPVLFSKLIPAETCYVTKKNAIKFFVKKEGSIEQDRNIETKDNTVVYERHGLIALVDDTYSIKLTKKAEMMAEKQKVISKDEEIATEDEEVAMEEEQPKSRGRGNTKEN